MCHGVGSEGDGGTAHRHDGGVECSAENQEGDGLKHGRSFRLVDGISLQADGLVTLQAVTVHPLSQGAVAVPQQGEDGTARRFEAVGHAVVGLETHPHGARYGVDAQGVDGGAVAGVDGVAHWLVACDGSLQGQGWHQGGSVCHPLDCPSAVSEDRHLSVFHFTSGEIVAQGAIVGCLPIYNQSDGHIVEVAIKLLSEVCLGLIPTNEAIITPFDVIDAILISEGINSIVSDQFATTNVLFVVINEHTLVVVIDELQNVIQSVVVLEQLFDLINSGSGEHFFVVSGQGHGHGVCLVDLGRIERIGQGVKGVGTPPGLSHTVQVIVERLLIGLPGSVRVTLQVPGGHSTRGGSVAGLFALLTDLIDVDVAHVVCLN